MDLSEAWVGERSASFVSAPDGGAIRPFGVRRKIEDVAITARAEHHRVRYVRLHLAGDQIPRDDASRLAIDHDHIEHFTARLHLHASQTDLTFKRLICAEQQLLARLA